MTRERGGGSGDVLMREHDWGWSALLPSDVTHRCVCAMRVGEARTKMVEKPGRLAHVGFCIGYKLMR
jgi:hypothetical protein